MHNRELFKALKYMHVNLLSHRVGASTEDAKDQVIWTAQSPLCSALLSTGGHRSDTCTECLCAYIRCDHTEQKSPSNSLTERGK